MNTDILINYLQRNRTSLSQEIYKEEASFKGYDRFSTIELPKPLSLHFALQDALSRRTSNRDYSKKPLNLEQISTFLFWSAGVLKNGDVDSASSRPHPSGGAKYPLELYLLILNGDGVEPGVYHYNIQNHTLEHLHVVDLKETLSHFEETDDYALDSGMIILFSFIKTRNMGKYGSLAYKLSFIESGCIMQNMYLLSAALGIGCCGMGLSTAPNFNESLKLDGINESIFSGFAVGNIKSNHAEGK
jgi:SagB-type dehydrogenase family enzyme